MSNIDNQEQIDRIIGAMKTKHILRLIWWRISMQWGKITWFCDNLHDGMCGDKAIEKVIKNDSI